MARGEVSLMSSRDPGLKKMAVFNRIRPRSWRDGYKGLGDADHVRGLWFTVAANEESGCHYIASGKRLFSTKVAARAWCPLELRDHTNFGLYTVDIRHTSARVNREGNYPRLSLTHSMLTRFRVYKAGWDL